jgi:hypothetical protein
VTSRQIDTYFTAENPSSEPVDVVFMAPRFHGVAQLYGYGFGSWNMSLSSTTLTCTATVPAGGSLTTPFIGYFARTPGSEVLYGTLSPAATPPLPFISLNFT